MAEDNEGRLVTINENKGGRVREKNDGTRCVEKDSFHGLVFLQSCISYLDQKKSLEKQARYKLEVEISQGWGV